MMRPITPKAVLDGRRYFEVPRWHSDQLWFFDCMNRTLLSLEPSGERAHSTREDDTPSGLSILPDGKLVVLTMSRPAPQPDRRIRAAVLADAAMSFAFAAEGLSGI
jgi:sugar lactone lactonase YvrE